MTKLLDVFPVQLFMSAVGAKQRTMTVNNYDRFVYSRKHCNLLNHHDIDSKLEGLDHHDTYSNLTSTDHKKFHHYHFCYV